MSENLVSSGVCADEKYDPEADALYCNFRDVQLPTDEEDLICLFSDDASACYQGCIIDAFDRPSGLYLAGYELTQVAGLLFPRGRPTVSKVEYTSDALTVTYGHEPTGRQVISGEHRGLAKFEFNFANNGQLQSFRVLSTIKPFI